MCAGIKEVLAVKGLISKRGFLKGTCPASTAGLNTI
jgi:hypothetical protein